MCVIHPYIAPSLCSHWPMYPSISFSVSEKKIHSFLNSWFIISTVANPPSLSCPHCQNTRFIVFKLAGTPGFMYSSPLPLGLSCNWVLLIFRQGEAKVYIFGWEKSAPVSSNCPVAILEPGLRKDSSGRRNTIVCVNITVTWYPLGKWPCSDVRGLCGNGAVVKVDFLICPCSPWESPVPVYIAFMHSLYSLSVIKCLSGIQTQLCGTCMAHTGSKNVPLSHEPKILHANHGSRDWE